MSGGLIGSLEPSKGRVDLDGDRLRIEFVKLMLGGRGKEFGSAHAEVPCPRCSTLEGLRDHKVALAGDAAPCPTHLNAGFQVRAPNIWWLRDHKASAHSQALS